MLASRWVWEAHAPRVQQVTAVTRQRRPLKRNCHGQPAAVVQWIAEQRMPCVRHVDADLVRPSRRDLHLDERALRLQIVSWIAPQNTHDAARVLGAAAAAGYRAVNRASPRGVKHRPNRAVDLKARLQCM